MTRGLILIAILALAAACGERIEPGQSAAETVVVSGLTTVTVEPVAVPARHALPGTIESIDRGLLTARIPGQVASLLVGKGQAVKPGDVLLTLTGETATSELRAAKSGVTVAERRLAEARTYLQLAETTYLRFVKLRDAGAVTPHEFDQVLADRDAATERLAAAEAALETSRAQHSSARTLADQATVRAPYTATVAEVLVDAGSTVLPGTPLIHLDRSGPWLVRVELPEALAARHRPGDRFSVEIPSLEKVLSGTLTELLPSASPASRTISVWLTLPEEAALKSGLFARVLVSDGTEATTLMIPSVAVVTRGQLTGVYVVEDEVLHYRLVRTGSVHADRVEILSGLRAGEEIVAGDLPRARHGARLERPK